jgi:hypothetical protein
MSYELYALATPPPDRVLIAGDDDAIAVPA